MKKMLIAAAVIGSGLLLVGMVVLVSILASFEEGTVDKEPVNIVIPCTITGTRDGDRLDLTLSYSGMNIGGIRGAVSDNAFSASCGGEGDSRIPMDLPGKPAKLGTQTFMSYTAVTSTLSPQYKLLNSDVAADDGIYRKVNGRYAIALGSFYGRTIGTEYLVDFRQPDGTTRTIPAILGDCKADTHTDPLHQYHAGGIDHGNYYPPDFSVLEFITAAGTDINAAATQSRINSDFGEITAIYRTSGASVDIRGTIDGNRIEVTGSVDGQSITASGSLLGKRVAASGFIGEGQSGTVPDSNIVAVAASQIGNQGGYPYWSWYGFTSHVHWCACFVSWCANECGYIEDGTVPKFSSVELGLDEFRKRGQFQAANDGYIPKPGDIIFFDWTCDGVRDHVGIVENATAEKVHTIEGNSSDMCRRKSYDRSSACIYGYALPGY